MIDIPRASTLNKFKNLLIRRKINNHQKVGFMSNSIELFEKMDRRITDLEKKVKQLEEKD